MAGTPTNPRDPFNTLRGGNGVTISTNAFISAATGGQGINVSNSTAGAIDITATGQVTGTSGISARNLDAADILIHAGAVTGTKGSAIVADNGRGTGKTVIRTDGLVTSLGGREGDTGIQVVNGISTLGGVSINAADVQGVNGISSINAGAGTNEVVVRGDVVATGLMKEVLFNGIPTIPPTFALVGGRGISLTSDNAGAATNGTGLSVRVNGSVNAAAEGIYAFNNGKGASATGVYIVTNGAVTSTHADGITVGTGNMAIGDVTLQSNGSVTGSANGISAKNNGLGDVNITASNVKATGSNGRGIDAYSGKGNVTISATGAIEAAATGIGASTNTKTGGGVIVNAYGPVVATGPASSNLGATGIFASARGNVMVNSFDTISVASKVGSVAIKAESAGTGNVSITTNDVIATGSYSYGVWGMGSRDIMIHTKGNVTAGGWGIRAVYPTGAPNTLPPGTTEGIISVVADRDVKATNAANGSLLNPVSAILIQASGKIPTTTVETGGTVTSNETGINMLNLGNHINGQTYINIRAESVVEGGSDAIRLAADLAQTATINNAGIVRNKSALPDALAIRAFKQLDVQTGQKNLYSVSVVNSGLVQGTVDLGGPDNSFVNQSGGVWNTAGGTNWLTSDLVSGGDGKIVNAGTIIAATQGASGVVTTTFNGVGANSLDNAGLLTMRNEVTGDITVINGHYNGFGGVVAIDTVLGDDLSATDKLVINGDTSGSSRVQVVNVGGTGAPTVEGIRIIEVGGASNGS
ncbi:autotransporter outer membrane beta-barrel domain-containing protein, partial [Ochrobactrum sp. SFR4]|uniref:autotransporter outer membrane beta-barrel domain-containing protein n=1 Tax=Ochrobactrum sp. SFR4 TaxID=2717368 RepID=UPI001C8C0033